jgi:ATP-dependent helicase/nuclease subunit B
MDRRGFESLFAPDPAVYTIPAGRPFLPEVVRVVAEAYADDPLSISDLTIFLPNRRAIRTIGDAFQAHAAATGRAATVMPKLRALGDLQEEDLILSGTPLAETLTLPPAPDPLARRVFLARALRYKAEVAGEPLGWAAALQTAIAFERLVDEFHTEGIPMTGLATVVAPDIVAGAARHWQESLELLDIVLDLWPQALKDMERMDAADRRARLMTAFGEAIARENTGPVIVAGALGSARPTAAFLAQVARSPQGLVILPGYEHLPEGMDDLATPPHPQALFRERLWSLWDEPPVVRDWPGADDEAAGAARRALLSVALRPAAATGDWFDAFQQLDTDGTIREGIEGLSLVVAATENEEADFIALALREALETPGRTAMFVTPDRELARRVSVKLRAWGITIDDSGGTPLDGTYRGTFLLALAHWLDDPTDPERLCTLLKHELCQLGMSRGEVTEATQAIDRALRGHRRDWGWKRLSAWLGETCSDGKGDDPVEPILTILGEAIDAMADAVTFNDRLLCLIDLAERFAATADEPGAPRLWRYEDGEELSAALHHAVNEEALNAVDDGTFADIIAALLADRVVRPRGSHPRLAIYGLVEARLQSADLVILGGLNEGRWPGAASTDPFLSVSMRTDLGLLSPELTVARAAHDFLQHAAAPQVLLTCAKRKGRLPATPSRWIVRLTSFIEAARLRGAVDRADTYRAWAAARAVPPDVKPLVYEPPAPSRVHRPKRISVSDIELLIRDPYSVYAKHVLGLRSWEVLGERPGYLHRGQVLHGLMERTAGEAAPDWDTHMRELMDEIGLSEGYLTIWSRTLDSLVEGYPRLVAAFSEVGRFALAEAKAEWTFALDGGEVVIRGIPDRVDLCTDGSASIVDYKTGETPTTKQTKTFSLQLFVLGLMAEAGAWPQIGAVRVSRLTYVPLTKPEEKGWPFVDKHSIGPDTIDEELDEVRRRLPAFIASFVCGTAPFPSKPRPFWTKDFGDYDHLARRGEWADGVAGDD